METSDLEIPKPANFSFAECRWFLDRNLDDCMHKVSGMIIHKAIAHPVGPVLFQLGENAENLEIKILLGNKKAAEDVRNYVVEWFDLNRKISGFYRLLKADPDFRPLYNKYKGLRLVGIPDLFELLCWCVIGQQINLAFAYKVKRALVEKFGTKIKYGGNGFWLFPRADLLSNISIDELRSLQLTTRKAEYIKGIAELFAEGSISKAKLLALNDENKMRDELMKVRGIGEWTANYAVMKGLGGMNCLPIGDSGINIALLQLKGIPKKNNRKQVESVFSVFEGWKSYLVYYLWRSRREPL